MPNSSRTKLAWTLIWPVSNTLYRLQHKLELLQLTMFKNWMSDKMLKNYIELFTDERRTSTRNWLPRSGLSLATFVSVKSYNQAESAIKLNYPNTTIFRTQSIGIDFRIVNVFAYSVTGIFLTAFFRLRHTRYPN